MPKIAIADDDSHLIHTLRRILSAFFRASTSQPLSSVFPVARRFCKARSHLIWRFWMLSCKSWTASKQQRDYAI